MAGAHHGNGLAVRFDPFDQQFDFAAAGLVPEEARPDDPCVVHHQQVAGLKQRGEVGKDMVGQHGLG